MRSVGVHIGALLPNGLLEILRGDGVVPLEHLDALVARDRHRGEGIHASSTHIGTEGMPEIVVGHARQPRLAAGLLERGRDVAGIIRLPVARHEHIAADVPGCGAQELRQPVGERDQARLIGLRVGRCQLHHVRLQVDLAPLCAF
jgi:hypothetical protein